MHEPAMNASQAERLTAIIEEEILSLRLKPGDKLDETRLAQKYGTSRTPVREALRQLSANGLIELRRHRGAVVARLGIRELVDVLEVMAELEGACGRLAAKACIKSDLDTIEEALAVCRQHADANDVQSYKAANEAFHETIYRASRNTCLISLTLSTRKRVAAYRRVQLEHAKKLPASVEEHERIARAIGQGLAEEADRLLQLHILNVGADLRRVFAMVSSQEFARPAGQTLRPALHRAE
jgi:DNA-binding GntR family transcriptional regulator